MTMDTDNTGTVADRALISAYTCQQALRDRHSRHQQGSEVQKPPLPATSRLESSHNERPYCLTQFVEEASKKPKDETVLYLAYGSNLASETFRGKRGIKPLSQINVQVPFLRLTFDLPGIPYAEPCFANTARRNPNKDGESMSESGSNEKTALLWAARKAGDIDGWHKGLVGVVYEVTAKDYAHIIETEGGGAGYQDILIDCHPFASSDPRRPVPKNPTLPAFKAHTLFAPAVPEGDPPQDGGHLARPREDYAQASARYLKLITDGAAECELPYEYQDYLLSLQPYTITTVKQRVGQFVMLMTWAPIIFAIFALGRLVADKNGTLPDWMKEFTGAAFKAVWASYDNFFMPIFGDGERTIEADDSCSRLGYKQRSRRAPGREPQSGSYVDLEKNAG